MRSTKVLEMLNSGRIEDLKKELEDEIYQEALKSKPGAKKRYAAMKRYFKYNKSSRQALQRPCDVEYQGKRYTSFTNGYTLALTTEDTGEIRLFNKDAGNYPDVAGLIKFSGDTHTIDISKVLAEAKSKGYKLTTKEANHGYKYLMLFDGSYYKIGLLDITYGIIDDGKPVTVYKVSGHNKPLTLENDIGYGLLMPIRYDGNPDEDGVTIIYVGAE